ncbi:MAG: glycosyltransferase family 39 protein [Luteimonas sp.]|nr:glycosyltransferase family 39 protein [Luteimonas sp.]
MRGRIDAKAVYVTLWAALVLAKAVIASRLPLFVDEAFYWQEGRHLAWAYSDLPGLTAWLIRSGEVLFGDGMLAVRTMFLLVAALLPWLVVRITAREVGEREAWVAGCCALLLPLFTTLGLLALPDVAMTLATVICLDAMTRMFKGVTHGVALQLALGLAIGALSHYRFIAVIGAGCLALLLLPQGRVLLRDPRVLVALAFGAAAWIPLLAWNIENAEAGLRFQLVDRHPWALHGEGLDFIPIQAAFVTPLLLVALLSAAWSFRDDARASIRFLALAGGVVVLGFFVLGFVADTERVSFHWPLPGYVALLPLLPLVLMRWPLWLRGLTWATAACGVLLMFGYYAVVSMPEARERTANTKWYPQNFSGWGELADAVRTMQAEMPAGTRIVADNFKVGAELGFALGDPGIHVLEHALNRAHGRAPQLRLWGLEITSRQDLGDGPLLLVASPSDKKLSELLDRYQRLCTGFGALPSPRVVDVDHGGKRFLLFALAERTGEADAACVTPAIAHVNEPVPDARVAPRFTVSGWAIKDVVGVDRVAVTLDGRVVAEAEYGLDDELPGQFYQGRSKDPALPRVGFRVEVDATDLPAGGYRLGLEITGGDGSVESLAIGRVVLRSE